MSEEHSVSKDPARPKDSKPGPDAPTVKKKSPSARPITLYIVLAVVAFVVLMGVGLYTLDWQDNFTRKVSEVVPYPAALVNGRIITVADYQDDVDALKKYFGEEQSLNLDEEDNQSQLALMSQSILNQLIEDKVTLILLKDRGVEISQDRVNEEMDKVIEQGGGLEAVTETLDTLYDWTPDQFKEKILIPQLRFEALQKNFNDDEEINKDQMAKAEEVLAEVKKGEKSFEDLAKEYSEGPTAPEGGDLGLVSRGALVTEFEDVAFAMEPGEVSGVVKTQFGFHIIKVEEKKDDQIRVRHILIQPADFYSWLEEQKAGMTIWRFIKPEKDLPNLEGETEVTDAPPGDFVEGENGETESGTETENGE